MFKTRVLNHTGTRKWPGRKPLAPKSAISAPFIDGRMPLHLEAIPARTAILAPRRRLPEAVSPRLETETTSWLTVSRRLSGPKWNVPNRRRLVG